MKELNQIWHSLVLATYQAQMFDSLIHPHNITTEGSKSYTFETTEGEELDPLCGFFAMKDVEGMKTKYFIEKEYFKELPIRVNKDEEMFYKDSARCKSIILRPLDITPFRIKPEKCWDDNKEFIDLIAPFSHSKPLYWTLNKLVAVSSYVGKTFCGICSLSEFGKSSIYLILDAITKKCPVFQPRSVPGVLAQITGIGNMIFDEVHDAPGDVKSCMENFSLQVAGNSPVYINGAMKSKNTKAKYDVGGQSITFLFNVFSNYSNPDKQFWNNIWANRKAMESRFLGLKFEGKLLEDFDKNFNIPKIAEDNKLFYIRIAKHLLYLKQLKLSNSYVRKYTNKNTIVLKGRHKIIYDEITWMIDLYAQTQEEYNQLIIVLNESITSYQQMICIAPVNLTPQIQLEDVLNDEERVIELIRKYGEVPIEQLLEETKVDESLIKKMLVNGTLFEPRPSILKEL